MSALAKAHERRFGVEIECGHPKGYTHVAQRMRDKGFPVSDSWDRQFNRYNIGSDGSGVEVRTPILQGMDGFNELKKVLGFLRRIGCVVTPLDGAHVHHDAPEYVHDRAAVRRLVRSWINNTNTIESVVAPSRRGRRVPWAERSQDQDLLDAIAAKQPYYTRGYYDQEYNRTITQETNANTRSCWAMFTRHDLNIAALSEHGTVEFRLMEGSLNERDVSAWIRFGQRLLDSVYKRKSAIPPIRDVDTLSKRIGLGERQLVQLKDKVGSRRWSSERDIRRLRDAQVRVARSGYIW